MKHRIIVLLIVSAFIFHALAPFCHAERAPAALSARSALLMDLDSGEVLFEKNAHERMGMASTTKIMTALTVLRLLSVDTSVTVPAAAVGTEGSSVYLCVGERLTVEQLLYALLLSSANDAAVALAIACSGSTEAFAEQMNLYAEELGLENTRFSNPHGLYDSEHYTTAYELAVISRKALENPTLAKIFSTVKAQIPFNGEENKRLLVNHNKMLGIYDGAIGVKTGFTKKTGRCLVSAAKRDGLTLISVTLNAPDDWRDHTAMLDYGFENYERRTLAAAYSLKYEMPTVGGSESCAVLTNSSPLVLTLPRSASSPLLIVEARQHFLFAPIAVGGEYGTVRAVYGEQTASSALTACAAVDAKHEKKGFCEHIRDIVD